MGIVAGEGHHAGTIIRGDTMKKNYADMEPLEEIRAIREEISRKFKTVEAYGDYLQKMYPMNPPPEPQRKNRRSSTKTKASGRPALRHRKATAHT